MPHEDVKMFTQIITVGVWRGSEGPDSLPSGLPEKKKYSLSPNASKYDMLGLLSHAHGLLPRWIS